MATDSQEGAGSGRPVPHMEPGDDVICDHCKRQVYLRPAPLDLASCRWPGEKHPRIEPHSAGVRAVRSIADMPGSEG